MNNPKKYFVIAIFIFIVSAIFLSVGRKPSPRTNANTPQAQPEYILPSGFPNIPVYPGAKLVPPLEDEDEKPEGITYAYEGTWETADTTPQVSQWYLSNPDKEWLIEKPPFDPGAEGQQIIIGTYRNWRANIILRKIDVDKPTLIMVGIAPK